MLWSNSKTMATGILGCLPYMISNNKLGVAFKDYDSLPIVIYMMPWTFHGKKVRKRLTASCSAMNCRSRARVA